MHVVFALIQGNLFQNQEPNSFQNTRTTTAARGLHTHASQHVWALIFAFKKLNLGSKSLDLVRNQNGQSEKTAVAQEREESRLGIV